MTMCTITGHGRLFGPDGCQVPVGNGTCGETRTLEIINEFRRLYEEKIQQIDSSGSGDCLQEKIKLQQDWIGDLTAQNEMLVKAVEELEHEATERVHLLEEKLQQSAKNICEVMKRYREYDITNDLLAEPLQKVYSLENDQKNLLEFIRRVREENRWDIKGLKFFEISYQDLFGCGKENNEEVEVKSEDQNGGTFKGETKLKNKESCVTELQKRLEHYHKFGDVESLSKELECKKEECINLQRSMKDTQQALVEEIASKHDIIVQLRRECQQLEERCIQADKQTAFRDDIIKELRKEIKQLKQQLTNEEITKLNETIDELQSNLQKTKSLQEEEEKRYEEKISQLKETMNCLVCSLKQMEEKFEKEAKICKICKGRAKISFVENAEVQACPNVVELEEQMESIEKRDEIIKVQTDTLNILQLEVQALKEQDSDLRRDRERKCCEVQCLKDRVAELESALEDAEGKAANLQTAVDLYLNSINVLEVTEEQYKVEIEQQKLTITNLQKALVATKQELDEIKQRSQENEHEQHGLITCFNVIMSDMECDKENLTEQYVCLSEEYEHLQDMNFDLEVEHCTSLQDVEIMENQLFKYQTLLRSSEDECSHYKEYCKKLAKQKKCYEEIVAYFKEEMSSMSEQLCNLQELLTLSNESSQEENSKLMQAFENVQAENEKLSTKLAAAQQKADLECQMNQLHETKISELQQLISDRELDLNRHDQAILNIRQSLQCSLAQNEELQMTIVELHETIAQLQNAVQMYENENRVGKEGTQQCWAQIVCCNEKLNELKSALDEKTAKLCKLEMAYNDQARELKSAQLELKEMRDKQKDKQRHLKTTVEDLREKLVKSEENYCKVCCEFSNLQTQLAAVARKEAVKDMEIKRYRKIVNDLKTTLIDLNKSLASGKAQTLHTCDHSKCRKSMGLISGPTEETKNQEICFKCPCEVEFYQSIVETLKESILDLKEKLNESQQINKELEEASKLKDAQLEELKKDKDKEYNAQRKKLTEKLKQTQAEEARYVELANQLEKELNTLREELQIKTLQLNDVKKSAEEINSSKCIQLVCAQEEVNTLKEELNRILRQHCSLNAENEKLHAQSACMQATISKLEEKSQLLRGQLEQYLAELQSVQTEKETLVRKNCELLSELRSLQTTFNSIHDQQRYTNDSVKILESEIHDLRNSRDEICIESKNVINYVRAWLLEQKKINEHTARRERDYCDTIQRLKQEYTEGSYMPPSQRQSKKVTVSCLKPTSPPPTCPSPWSLGSQGTASVYGGRSPSRSPCPDEECDWYSSTFRNESEEDDDDEDEEDWVTKVEHLAAQVRRTNKIWKNKMMSHPDDVVSRDTKK